MGECGDTLGGGSASSGFTGGSLEPYQTRSEEWDPRVFGKYLFEEVRGKKNLYFPQWVFNVSWGREVVRT